MRLTFAEMTAALMQDNSLAFVRVDDGPNSWKRKDGSCRIVFDEGRGGIAIAFNHGAVIADWKTYAADMSMGARYELYIEDEVEVAEYFILVTYSEGSMLKAVYNDSESAFSNLNDTEAGEAAMLISAASGHIVATRSGG